MAFIIIPLLGIIFSTAQCFCESPPETITPMAALNQSSAASDRKPDIYLLNVIVFESYMTAGVKEGSLFDRFDWSNSDFPRDFSKLVAESGPNTIQVPSGFKFPSDPMFLDIFSFTFRNTRLNHRSRFSRRNDITAIGYKAGIRLVSDESYEIELDGYHGDFKFRNVRVAKAPCNKTEMIRIRHSANRTLYFAFTFIPEVHQLEHGISPPEIISQPTPAYPSQLLSSKWAGRIRILCSILSTGKIDPQGYILLECPHTLFARISLDTIMNLWTFAPATRSGSPIDFRKVIEIPFPISSPELKLEFPIPKAGT